MLVVAINLQLGAHRLAELRLREHSLDRFLHDEFGTEGGGVQALASALFAIGAIKLTYHAHRTRTQRAVMQARPLDDIPQWSAGTTPAAIALRLRAWSIGVAIVTVPGGKMSAFDKVIGHQRHYTRAKLERLLTDAGFEVVTVLAWGFPFHTFYRTAVRVASGMTVPGQKQASEASTGKGVVSSVLGGAYAVFGKILKPLFYLNASRGGEQLIAVVKRRA